MGYSVNFYLDNAISEKSINELSINVTNRGDIQKKISTKVLQIFVYLRYSGKTIKVYTERKCTQKQWDSEKQRVDPRFYKSGSIQLNKYLGNIEEETGNLFETNNNQGILTTSEHVRSIIYRLNNQDKIGKRNKTFEEAFKEFIQTRTLKCSSGTISIYNTTLKHLLEFSALKKIPLTFEAISRKFESQINEYFIDEKKMSNNTIAKYIKTIKAFMRFATEERDYNHKTNLDYKRFVKLEYEKQVYALTIDELMKIYSSNFKQPGYNHAKDIFCFLCFTGLRISDAQALKKEEVKGDHIDVYINKTKEHKSISLNMYAKKILGKYSGLDTPLPVISEQKINEYLKKIGKKLKIKDQVRDIKHIGGKVIETFKPKYEILTTHLGRKTFVTSSLILGMNERTVREFSGHKKDANFRKYINFAESYKSKAMDETWNKKNISKAQK